MVERSGRRQGPQLIQAGGPEGRHSGRLDITLFLFQPAGSPVKHKVRTVTRDGEPWFVLADVCSVLELSNPTMVKSRLDDDEWFNLTLSRIEGQNGGARSQNIVNESGLWACVLRSDKPVAREFRKWITGTVIPTIRKTGSYVVGEEKLAEAKTPEDLDSLNEMIQAALQRKAGARP